MSIKEKRTILHTVIHQSQEFLNVLSFRTYAEALDHANNIAKSIHPAAEDYTEIFEVTHQTQMIDVVENTLLETFEIPDSE